MPKVVIPDAICGVMAGLVKIDVCRKIGRSSRPSHRLLPIFFFRFSVRLPLLRYLIPSFSFLLGVAAEPFHFPPPRGGGERHRRSGCCEAPGFACHDRHAGALFRRLASPLKRRRSPCGAPPWRFCGQCPCFPLSGIPCGVGRQSCSPPGSYCPQDRVSWTSTRCGLFISRAGDATPRSASRRLMKAPLDEPG